MRQRLLDHVALGELDIVSFQRLLEGFRQRAGLTAFAEKGTGNEKNALRHEPTSKPESNEPRCRQRPTTLEALFIVLFEMKTAKNGANRSTESFYATEPHRYLPTRFDALSTAVKLAPAVAQRHLDRPGLAAHIVETGACPKIQFHRIAAAVADQHHICIAAVMD